jgi:glycosyltransferase involved in cell wall biosynthesis
MFWTYAALGPGAWGLVLLGLMNSRSKMGKLKSSRAVLPERPPEVTVLIPAHNEAGAIEACLRSVLGMDYPSFRVVAIDDRSTDGTGAIMDRVSGEDPRLRVMHLTTRPEGWLGKCYALHAGGALEGGEGAGAPGGAIRTPWVLFVDSDVVVEPSALSRAMAMALAREVAAVSLLTRQRCETLAERLLTPIACAAILGMYLASHTNNDNRARSAFANGQFFLIRADAYRAAGGHEAVRQDGVEDVALMKRLKRGGAKCRLYSGDDLAETRMYANVRDMFKGWARIYSTASYRRPWRILVASGFFLSGIGAFVAAGVLGAVAVMSGVGVAWGVAAGVHLGLVLVSVGAAYRWSRNSVWLALLFPAAGAVQLAFFAYALYWCATKRFEWRGQSYAPLLKPADVV